MGQHPAGRASISGLAKFRSELTLPGVFVDKNSLKEMTVINAGKGSRK